MAIGLDKYLTIIKKRLNYVFPERELHIRSNSKVVFYKLSARFQLLTVFLICSLVGWTGYATWSFENFLDIIVAKDRHISNARLAYHRLLGDVGKYQKKFATVTQDLEKNHALMSGLVKKNDSLKFRLKNVSEKLEVTETNRNSVKKAREKLKLNLAEIETQLHDAANRNFSLEGSLTMVENDLQKALSDRNQALFASTELRQEINVLQNRLGQLEKTHISTLDNLKKLTDKSIDEYKSLVRLTGLNVNKLTNSYNELYSIRGIGGPFFPADMDDLPGNKLKYDLTILENNITEWQLLKQIVRYLPLASPLTSYYVSSGFGKRRDPFNKRWAAHYGIDLAGQLKSPIFATAAGVVSFVGNKGRYGRLIEIKHNGNITTKYGHLNKILVKRGQKVKPYQKIGLLGNSGRSSGAHVHYEILFKGKPMNPHKFIKAGRYVFKNEW